WDGMLWKGRLKSPSKELSYLSEMVREYVWVNPFLQIELIIREKVCRDRVRDLFSNGNAKMEGFFERGLLRGTGLGYSKCLSALCSCTTIGRYSVGFHESLK